jgi:integrase
LNRLWFKGESVGFASYPLRDKKLVVDYRESGVLTPSHLEKVLAPEPGFFPEEKSMRRRYYLHTRHNGIFYAELVDPRTGVRLTAHSTGTKNRDEAMLTIAEWLKFGLPSSCQKQSRSIETIVGLDGILKAIRKSNLTPDDAMRIVNVLRELEFIDIPVVKAGPGTIHFVRFLEKFWDYEKSPYIRDKLAHGQSLGRRHSSEMLNRVITYWKPYFEGRSLNSIIRADLKAFSLHLADKRPPQAMETPKKKGRGGKIRAEKLSPGSINKIMMAGTAALAWAYREGMIPTDPAAGLVRFVGQTKKRGVLTPKEAAAVFSVKWQDERSYVGNLLSITTGLRSGEVLALRRSDMDMSLTEKVLYIKHSWSSADGLKLPKNGEARKVPLLPEVRTKLLDLLSENPHKKEQDASENPDKREQDFFVFYGSKKDKPTDNKLLIDSLKEACREVGNNPDGWVTDLAAAGGEGSLWMIRGEKNASGNLQGKWTTPEKVAEKDLLSVINAIPAAAKGNPIEIRYRRCIQKPDAPMVIDPVARGIVFHSHRHYYAARMVDKMTAEQVSRITGHKSRAVFEEYADHVIEENLEQMSKAGAEVFGNILSFKRGA